jgi:hypothetical protein
MWKILRYLLIIQNITVIWNLELTTSSKLTLTKKNEGDHLLVFALKHSHCNIRVFQKVGTQNEAVA